MGSLAKPVMTKRTYEIPDKLYFKIGEVAEITGVKPYVLRYWESEFKMVSPSKSRSRQRLYKRQDVELILWIKELLYEDRYTINGARKKLREMGYAKSTPQAFQPELQFPGPAGETGGILDEAIQELHGIKDLLSEM